MIDLEYRCFFEGRDGAGLCEGALVRAHLIAKQRIKRAFPKGAWKDGDFWLPRPPFEALTDPETAAGWTRLELQDIQDDPRCWVPMCGGSTGIGGHHGRFDNANDVLSIPRVDLPEAVEDFAVEFRLVMELDRVFGQRPIVAMTGRK